MHSQKGNLTFKHCILTGIKIKRADLFFLSLTDGIFEIGAYGVPSKSQNPTVLGQSGPSSTQCSNPSWAYCWHHPFGTNNYPPF